MLRSWFRAGFAVNAVGAGAVLMLLVPVPARADAYADLMKVQAAFHNAKSWHADESFSNGRTVAADFVAPDRWRVQPSPKVTELVIGNDIYMVSNGKTTKLPFGGGMIRNMIQNVGFSVQPEIQQTAKDLGMQTVDGQTLHAYSYTVKGTPVTLYVDANWLPVRSVVQDKKVTTTIQYSQYNQPITIEAQ